MKEQKRVIQNREIVNVRVKREEEFPEDPEKRFEAVFSAIGNSEAKCLTLLCLSQSPITRHDLHRRFLNESGRVWKISRSTPGGYCLHTLIPIGLVAEADTLYSGSGEYVAGFRLTEAGLKFGQPVAAFLLEQSSKQPESFLDLFGHTSNAGGVTRSPINRSKILETLLSEDTTLTAEDIARLVGISHNVISPQLANLSKLKLINYSSIGPEAGEVGYSKYTLTAGAKLEEIAPYPEYGRLTREVANLLFELKTADRTLLAEELKDKYPVSSRDTLVKMISHVLGNLERQGFCQRVLFRGRKVLSQASISEKGRELVIDVIHPIKRALADDQALLSQWKTIPWQNYVVEAVSKYKTTSGHVNSRDSTDRAEEVLEIIYTHPGIRPREIQSVLSGSPHSSLTNLLDRGQVRKERQGKAVRYYPVETNK